MASLAVTARACRPILRYYFGKRVVRLGSFGGRISPDVRFCPPVNAKFSSIELMRRYRAISRRLWHALYRSVPCVAVCAGLLAAAVPSRAQDVAEAARQEKARKAKEQKAERHVYTNDDLKREHILTPGDQARAEANKKNSPAAPANQRQQASEANKNSGQESLGEIARRYRREEAAREAEEALKKESPSGFPMNVPAQTFASPMDVAPKQPVVGPRREIRPPKFPEKILRSAPRSIAPNLSGAPRGVVVNPSPNSYEFAAPRRPFVPKRVSPFHPRPYFAPAAPEAPPRTLHVVPAPPQPPARALRTAPVSPLLPPVETIRGKVKAIIVQAGDSWWKLSREYLGRGSRWQEVMALNPGQANPDFLEAGREVLVPVTRSIPAERQSQITVQKGDTLWSLAKAHLGSGLGWTCLAQANRDISNPNMIYPGELVRIPSSCQARP
jgi:nucleoid-associated protein YgaU